MRNYLKLQLSPEGPISFHFFDDSNELSTIRALGRLALAFRGCVFRRPAGALWSKVPEVGEGPTWTESQRAAFDAAEAEKDVA